MAKQPPPAEADATLNLNAVEAEEAKEHMYAAGERVAGATDPYSRPASYAFGTTTAGAEGGAGLGYGPDNTPADAAGLPGGPQAAGEQHGLAKVKEIQEALGMK